MAGQAEFQSRLHSFKWLLTVGGVVAGAALPGGKRRVQFGAKEFIVLGCVRIVALGTVSPLNGILEVDCPKAKVCLVAHLTQILGGHLKLVRVIGAMYVVTHCAHAFLKR
jgi:hypothetical protein